MASLSVDYHDVDVGDWLCSIYLVNDNSLTNERQQLSGGLRVLISNDVSPFPPYLYHEDSPVPGTSNIHAR